MTYATHRARKRFGQHFLQDQQVIDQIIRAIDPQPGERLLEIGPGLGAITLPLLRRTGAMMAVELDRDVIPRLIASTKGLGELTIFQADALRFDFREAAGTEGKLRLLGNLPYNISTPLLFHFLEQKDCVQDMHFMLQKEVVDRMAAGPGSKTYGRLSVMLQAAATVEQLFDIGREAFSPPPKVNSSFVRLVPYVSPPFPIKDYKMFAFLVVTAFSQRRKTLRNSLKTLLDSDQIELAGVNPAARAETLEPEQFAQLASLINSDELIP
ncbi:MAG: 16S rRNA (adenine(1518)-N(6)/adenine(1519)-N(6))-dimethyltransferase RsmA [Gammaproteobacteria bacterium]|jgi:16S rRNA (adenine1518-N6/adenine1519-N6)-dimethyltransferase|nr:16S rRNA (adenine(1518)-N(6)/adenine(1519)-N(6))-dimethyltransferase RsmA [Gammaproteobacteria bacterium]